MLIKRNHWVLREEENGSGAAAGSSAAPAAPASTTATPTPAPQARGEDGKFVPKEQYERAVGDARADAAAERKAAKAAKEASDAALAAAKTAQEEAARKITEETEKANARVKIYEPRIIESELKIAAIQAGLNDLDLLALVKRDALKLDENGNVTGVAEAIAAFKESKPAYFAAATQQTETKPGPTGSSAAPAPASSAPATDLRTLSKEDYNARKKELHLKLATKK